MRLSRVTFAVLVALLGLSCAAGITYAASRLVSQPIGLSSEPRDLSRSLTPLTTPARTPAAHTPRRHTATTTAPTTTAPTTPARTTPDRTTSVVSAPPLSAPSYVAPATTTGRYDGDGDSDD